MKSRRFFIQASMSYIAAVLGQPLLSLANPPGIDQPMTLHFAAIDLRQLLRLLAEMRGLNLILSDKVQGQTTLHMKNSSWDAIFESVIASKGLSYRINGDVIWVATHEELKTFNQRQKEKDLMHHNSSTQDLRQIMIEARIVEAERRFAQNLGAKLAYQQLPGFQANHGLPAAGLNGFEPGTAAITLLGKQATQALNIELSALESNGLGNIVSNPRVLAAENTQALIEQGTELPYQSSAGQGATKVQFRKANLRLEVKPRIQKNHMIVLEVDINKDSVGVKTDQGFAIDTKHVKTQVLVESGGTVILGGIFQEMERKDDAKVPFFSAIPLIGALFRQEAKFKDKTELLIFLTPTLVSGPKAQ